MNIDVPAPLERLEWFKTMLGLDRRALDRLNPHRKVFIDQKDRFAEDFFDHFQKIMETRVYLDHEQYKGHLKKAWSAWFELFFMDGFSEKFLTYQWRSGLRHVEVGVDHRFIILGYSYLRQFCQGVVRSAIPIQDHESLLEVIHKMVDFCLLIETQAFIEATSQCDIEVVRGISHQVRNPLTIIGGNILRLKKKTPPDSAFAGIYDTILGENKRLEAMVNDVALYSEMFQKEPVFSRISLMEMIPSIIERLRDDGTPGKVQIVLDLSPEAWEVHGDRDDLHAMFFYILQNSIEGAGGPAPMIRISSKPWKSGTSFVEVEVFNTGQPPTPEDMADLFVPFHSSKPYGTGFGLPIARLAARKNLGDLFLEPVRDEGVRCIIKLPAFVKDD